MGETTETMVETKSTDYKFEDWRELWETSPETFEYLRKKQIERLIDNAPLEQQKRLRCWQWKIDMVRERAANPLAATVELSEMMWDSFTEMDDTFKDISDLSQGRKLRHKKSEAPATILEFLPT